MKHHVMYSLLAAATVFVTQLALAQESAPAGGDDSKVYRQVNPDGTVTFTDKPVPGAEEVKVPKTPTYEPPRVPAFTPYKPPEKPETFSYDSLQIVSPANEETIRDNQGNVSVTINLSPALHGEHTIEILLDGNVVATGAQQTFQLQGVHRGTHTITARIVDSDGAVLKSQSSTIYMHQASINSPAGSPLFKPKPTPLPTPKPAP